MSRRFIRACGTQLTPANTVIDLAEVPTGKHWDIRDIAIVNAGTSDDKFVYIWYGTPGVVLGQLASVSIVHNVGVPGYDHWIGHQIIEAGWHIYAAAEEANYWATITVVEYDFV